MIILSHSQILLIITIFSLRIGGSDIEISWDYLKENLRDHTPEDISAWKSAHKAKFAKLGCTILPAILNDAEDMVVLKTFGPHVISTEDCLKQAIDTLIRSKVSPELFGDFIYSQKEWIPESYWGDILKTLRETPTDQFPQYYLQVVRCFDFVEAMAPHFRPALENLDEPSASVVRLTPLYFILDKVDVYIKRRNDDSNSIKVQDQYSNRLREEFATILQVKLEEPMAGYLTALDLYLEATQYLKLATLNEGEYFNLNYWIRTNFLLNPQVEDFIIRHDLYRLSYLYYLTGMTSETITKFIENCAFGSMALYLGRSQPSQLQISNKACTSLKMLADLYNHVNKTKGTIIPCKRKGMVGPAKRLEIVLAALKKMLDKKLDREAYLALHMLLRRLFEVSFDYLRFEDFAPKSRDLGPLINDTLDDYCSAFGLKRALTVVEQEKKTNK